MLKNRASYAAAGGLAVCLAVAAGCRQGTKMDLAALPADEAAVAGYYLPVRIEILPFTKVGSFDARGLPDGINAVVRPVDVMGDSVKAYGTMRFELYDYVPASALRRGEQLMVWNQTLQTPDQQSKHWDGVTQSYQFQLAWRQPLQPNRKYILEVVYTNPAGERLTSEHVLEFAPSASQIRQQLGVE